jgi:hypothetical protein
MSGEISKPDKESLGNLSAELKAINRTNLDDMRAALRILNADSRPDPKELPTRQQRRKAERDARKAGR